MKKLPKKIKSHTTGKTYTLNTRFQKVLRWEFHVVEYKNDNDEKLYTAKGETPEQANQWTYDWLKEEGYIK